MTRRSYKAKKLKNNLPPVLTPRQVEIIKVIHAYRSSKGCSPTMQEMADTLGLSKVTVFEHVEALVSKGVLIREPNKTRSLIINPDTLVPLFDEEDEVSKKALYDSAPGRYPLAGSIKAGNPQEVYEIPDQLEVSSMFETADGTYALKVRGDSMIDDHICDEDFVLVRKTQNAHPGDIVVAILPQGEATLKRFYPQGGKVRLQPANAQYEPIIVDHVQIQGVVIGVIRCY